MFKVELLCIICVQLYHEITWSYHVEGGGVCKTTARVLYLLGYPHFQLTVYHALFHSHLCIVSMGSLIPL